MEHQFGWSARAGTHGVMGGDAVPRVSLVDAVGPDLHGDPPAIRMNVNWNLVFGERNSG